MHLTWKRLRKSKTRKEIDPSSSFPLSPVKPDPEQVSVFFDPEELKNGEKSHPLYGDTTGLTRDYWGNL